MRKEIGSIFPLDGETISQEEVTSTDFSDTKIYYSLCREALFDIAASLQGLNKTVFIPAYTCQTVITPFEEAGWQCVFYSIQKNLRIDIQNLSDLVNKYNPSVLLVHPFFGMELNSQEEHVLQQISEKKTIIVLDKTQCLFSKKRYPFVSYTVGSFRKWFPIPDGGFIERNIKTTNIPQPQKENTEFTDRELAAMYLRGQYFKNGEQRTKDISIRLSKAADLMAENNIIPHKMSQVAYNLLQREDIKRNQKSRFNNFSYLYNNIRESSKIIKVCQDYNEVTTAPLYFTIYVDDRRTLQRLLSQDAIYAPVLWPVEDEKVLIDDVVKYIYEHILAIPIDQRYNESDMQRVIEIVNHF